jgi:hypothetical protein
MKRKEKKKKQLAILFWSPATLMVPSVIFVAYIFPKVILRAGTATNRGNRTGFPLPKEIKIKSFSRMEKAYTKCRLFIFSGKFVSGEQGLSSFPDGGFNFPFLKYCRPGNFSGDFNLVLLHNQGS